MEMVMYSLWPKNKLKWQWVEWGTTLSKIITKASLYHHKLVTFFVVVVVDKMEIYVFDFIFFLQKYSTHGSHGNTHQQ